MRTLANQEREAPVELGSEVFDARFNSLLFPKVAGYKALENIGLSTVSDSSLRSALTDFYELRLRRIQEFEDTAYTIAEAYIAVIARFTDPVWSLPPESQSLDFSKLPQLYVLDVNGEELLVERAFTRELIIMHGQTKFVHRVYRETDQEIIQLREILQSHLAAII